MIKTERDFYYQTKKTILNFKSKESQKSLSHNNESNDDNYTYTQLSIKEKKQSASTKNEIKENIVGSL